MSTEFWIGMTTLPVATGLVALALITVSRIPTEIFGKCRRGHRAELVHDREDDYPDKIIGTTWECVECRRAWRAVGHVGRAPVPMSVSLKKESDE
ncbi:hypothetical protein ACTXMZ_15530 [Brachybacterium alimentarium]|uniref:hypothetical protein n=1 Tax=Brachybacterium alimentarium TaxID=47845 RepID=UPI003FCF06E4